MDQSTENIQPQSTVPTPAIAVAPGFAPLPPIGDLFRESFLLLQRRIMTMFLSLLLPLLALLGLAIALGLLTLVLYKTNQTAGVIFGIICGILVFVGYIYALLLMMPAQLVALRDAEEQTGVIENLKRSRLIIGSFFLVSLILQMVSLGGYILLVVPGIILTVRYGFAPTIMAFEGKKGRSALAQSKAYVMGRSWSVFWRDVLLALAFYVPYIAIQLGMGANKNKFTVIGVTILLVLLQIGYYFYVLAFKVTLYKQLKNTAPQASGEQYISGVTGWTIWGCIGGVLMIIIIFASVVLLALNSGRTKVRDAGRLADVRMMMPSLELYYLDHDTYPKSLQDLSPEYLKDIPQPRMPNDGKCTEQQNKYTYTQLKGGQDYKLDFCLGTKSDKYESGLHSASYAGLK